MFCSPVYKAKSVKMVRQKLSMAAVLVKAVLSPPCWVKEEEKPSRACRARAKASYLRSMRSLLREEGGRRADSF